MSRGKQGFLSFVAALATVAVVAVAPASAVETSDSVAASDELAPEAPTNLSAFPGTAGVELTWELSVSDFVRPSPTGTDFTSGGSFANANDVAGYNIWRNGELIDSVDAGETMYVDALAAGSSIIYVLTAFDAAGNESAESGPTVVTLGPPPVAVVPAADTDLGEVGLGESATETIVIENNSTEEGSLLIATFALLDGGQGFSVSSASVQAGPGGTAEVSFTFDAAAVGNINGDYVDTVRVRTNDPNNPTVLIALFARITNGIDVQDINVSQTAVAFNTRRVINTVASRELVISNTGGLLLTGTISLTGDDAFSLLGGAELSLDAGESRTVSVQFAPTAAGSYSGTLIIDSNDPDEAQVIVPLSGGAIETARPQDIATVSKAVIKVGVTIDLNDEAARAAFIESMLDLISQLLGISRGRILISNLQPGSTIFDIQITNGGGAEGESTASAAVTELVDAVAAASADSTVTDPFVDFGGSESAVDDSEVVSVLAVDDENEPILGWFTRTEDQVGLADFFSFADEYGKSNLDPTFDEAYDIAPDAPDGLVGLEDFFVFADNYGKVVVNADEIRAALQ